jgi:hypothetical protein
MKRFAALFASLVLSIPITGCGGGASTATGPGGDANLPSEVKEYEARRAGEIANKTLPGRPGPTNVRKPSGILDGSLSEPGAK